MGARGGVDVSAVRRQRSESQWRGGMNSGTVYPEDDDDAGANEVTALQSPTPPTQPRGRNESQRVRPPELTHLRAEPPDADGAPADMVMEPSTVAVDVRSHLDSGLLPLFLSFVPSPLPLRVSLVRAHLYGTRRLIRVASASISLGFR